MPVPSRRALLVLLLSALVLLGAAWQRGAEYDEQYTAFLLAGDARPVWPQTVFAAGAVRDRFRGDASLTQIAADLRHDDVHPPLYFWALAGWSRLAGAGLWRLRLFSVLCSLGALATVGLIARRIGAPPALAMLLTLGCYAFAYTGSVARGFALAQMMALLGVLAALHRLPPRRAAGMPGRFALCGGAGLLLGAASFANYLAVFTALPVLACLARRSPRDAAMAAGGLAVFVAADLSFFVAQRASRVGQFAPFHLGAGLLRLATYGAASVAGGLPLYVPAALSGPVGAASGLVVAGAALLVAARWGRIGRLEARRLLAGAVLATPAGLLALGLVFDNTPIELRYLAFATPYAALLLAGALASLAPAARRGAAGLVLAVQAAAIAGLLARPETMQPMRAAARDATRLAGAPTVLLLPRGNDGVGLVGAFLTESPDTLRVKLVDRGTDVGALHGLAPSVALVMLDRDAASHATLAALLAGFRADKCWREAPADPRRAGPGPADTMLVVFVSACGGVPDGAGQAVADSASR